MFRATRAQCLLVGALVGLGPALLAQQQGRTGRIAGRVIDARTGQPLEAVQLRLVPRTSPDHPSAPEIRMLEGEEQARSRRLPGAPAPPAPPQLRAETDASGRFELPGLEPGRYQLLVTRRSYLQAWLRESPIPSVRDGVITIEADQSIDNVTLAMMPGGTIRGRLSDPEGQPVRQAMVIAIPLSLDARSGPQTGGGTSDEAGAYSLDGLPPGLYALRAQTLRVGGAVADDARTYRPTFYPGVETQAEAVGIRVSTGEVVDGIDLMMIPDATPVISGTVLRQSSDGPIDLQLRSAMSLDRIAVAEDGTFRFRPGRPMRGPHLLIASASTADGKEVGVEPLDLTTDLTNRLVRLEAGGTIAGQVVLPDGAPFIEQTLRVAALLQLDGQLLDPIGRDQVEADEYARFVIDGVIGERRIEVYGLPAGWAIDRVVVGDTPVTTITAKAGRRIDEVRVVVRPR